MGTTLHPFDWMATHPKHQHAFDLAMTMRTKGLSDVKWFDVYLIKKSLAQVTLSLPFVVDIVGGLGHNMISLKKLYPNIPGTLIVQDVPAVIDNVKNLQSRIEPMAHDFFRPQPIPLAHIYFFAHILHDWPDKQAKIILEHIRDAMGPDSILLPDEAVMPKHNMPYLSAVMDLTMMAAYSFLERTVNQYRTY
jgi:hypothetical protein